MIRLRRRRGPSAQEASSPRAARSSSAPKRARMCSSRRWRRDEASSPNQKRMRRFSVSADGGAVPNQKSRTLRASSMSPRRFGTRLVGLEQGLELLRGGTRGGEEFLLVLLDLVLRLQSLLVVLAEAAHRFACAAGGFSERLEHRAGHLETRCVSLADDLGNSGVHERERVLAAAGARE